MSGIIFRREPKINLVNEPPVIGEMVFALDTGEHGWLDENRGLVWKKLDIGGSNFYNKAEIDAALILKMDAALAYTKDEIDAEMLLVAKTSDVFTKMEIFDRLILKANKTQVYTKTQSDSSLGQKADKVSTYSKTEVDAALSVKVDSSDASFISSVITTGTQVIQSSLTVNQDFRAGTITETSSIRFKENVHRLTDYKEILSGLAGVRYDWKESGKADIGFIAEDVQKVLPELVLVENGKVQGMNYGKITAVLTEVVKDQQKQIAELKILVGNLLSKK